MKATTSGLWDPRYLCSAISVKRPLSSPQNWGTKSPGPQYSYGRRSCSCCPAAKGSSLWKVPWNRFVPTPSFVSLLRAASRGVSLARITVKRGYALQWKKGPSDTTLRKTWSALTGLWHRSTSMTTTEKGPWTLKGSKGLVGEGGVNSSISKLLQIQNESSVPLTILPETVRLFKVHAHSISC